MSVDQIQLALDRYIEALTRYDVMLNLERQFSDKFEATLTMWRKTSKGRKKDIATELEALWLEWRTSVRARVELQSKLEKCRAELDTQLRVTGQRLGERLPDDILSPTQGKLTL